MSIEVIFWLLLAIIFLLFTWIYTLEKKVDEIKKILDQTTRAKYTQEDDENL